MNRRRAAEVAAIGRLVGISYRAMLGPPPPPSPRPAPRVEPAARGNRFASLGDARDAVVRVLL